MGLTRIGLAELGLPTERAQPMADLLLDTIDGLLLDRLVRADSRRADAAAEAFAQLLDGVGL